MKETKLFVYKCRLCGKVHADVGGLFDFTEAATELSKEKSNIMGLTRLHNCKDGSIGVSDLQGIVSGKAWCNCSDQVNTTN